MKKVGIVTLHFSVNFGATLQCLALTETLKKMGFDSKVINYYPKYAKYYWEPKKTYLSAIKDSIASKKRIEDTDETRNSLFILTCLKSFKHVHFENKRSAIYKKKYKAFKDFQNKYIPLTKEYEHKTDLNELAFDVLVTGSDQVWNSNYTNFSLDEVYFLKFGCKDAKRISYAASTHFFKNNDYWDRVLSLLSGFDRISLREKNICDKINKLNPDIEAQVVLDPTLLLTADEWVKFEKNIELSEKYILCYSLRESQLCQYYINKYIGQESVKIIDISPNKFVNGAIWMGDCAPDVFLYLVHHADMVITDSFHGTVFSILYNKKFLSITNTNSDTRIKDILSALDLEDRLKNDRAEFPKEKINYSVINDKLKDMRRGSIDFLKQGLEY